MLRHRFIVLSLGCRYQILIHLLGSHLNVGTLNHDSSVSEGQTLV